MHDTNVSDSDNLSFDSGSDHEDDVNNDSYENNGPMYDPKEQVQTSEHMGELLTAEFGPLHEYEDDEERDIFDDGLDGDESSDSGSEASTTYEELDEPETVVGWSHVAHFEAELFEPVLTSH